MKTIIKYFFAALLIGGTAFAANAQESQSQVSPKPGKYEVTTRLTEKVGTYEQRKLYREFLTEYMKNCPYISNFSVHEMLDAHNNHDVVWTYEVNGWNDITKFYSWIAEHLKDSQKDGLKMSMTPYAPDYAIGGEIHLEKRNSSELAKNKNKSNNPNG